MWLGWIEFSGSWLVGILGFRVCRYVSNHRGSAVSASPSDSWPGYGGLAQTESWPVQLNNRLTNRRGRVSYWLRSGDGTILDMVGRYGYEGADGLMHAPRICLNLISTYFAQ